MTRHDESEIAEAVTSITADKGAAARAGYGSVSAVVAVPRRERSEPARSHPDRFETYDVEGPDGEPVTITRNIETGEVSVGAAPDAGTDAP
jgi:hypothetical protein